MKSGRTKPPSAGGKIKRGRPPLRAGQPKRASFSTRLSPQLKRELIEAADDAGRSLSEEIEWRLELSALGGTGKYAALARYLAWQAFVVEEANPMLDDYSRYQAVRQTWIAVLDAYAPPEPEWHKERSALYNKILDQSSYGKMTPDARATLVRWARVLSADQTVPPEIRDAAALALAQMGADPAPKGAS